MSIKPKTVLWIFWLVGLWGLAACGPSTPVPASPTSDNPPVNTPGNPFAEPLGPAAPTDESRAAASISLAYNPADGTLLKADTQGLSLWRADSGWQNITLPQTGAVTAVLLNPDEPTTLYVSGADFGVLRSDDEGGSWQDINDGLPELTVTALALHSFRRETVFAWVQDTGIYRTEDGGAQWVKVPDQGPPDKEVHSLVHSTLPGSMNTGWLYASTPTGAYLSMDCF